MGWRIELHPAAAREIDRLDPPIARRVLSFLADRLAPADDPRSLGAPLRGPRFGALWKYRVGDYRIIAELQDQALLVLVVRVGARREVYRR